VYFYLRFKKNKMFKFFPVISICLILLLAAGCGLIDDDNENVTRGNLIGSQGGSVEISSVDSSIYRAKIVVPANALTESISITMGASDSPDELPGEYQDASPNVRFEPSGTQFLKPVEITIPYNDYDDNGIIDDSSIQEEHIQVMYYNTNDGEWVEYEKIGQDFEKNLVTFKTSHFSTYLVYVDTTTSSAGSYKTGDYFLGSKLSPYYMTILRRETGLSAVVGNFPTFGPGLPGTIAADYKSITVDTNYEVRSGNKILFENLFTRIKDSESAEKWTWTCEFNSEHTNLNNYNVNDDSATKTETGTKVYCAIAASGNNITITPGIDLNEAITLPTPVDGVGEMLVVEIRASYK
jgi:hypothetical protein